MINNIIKKSREAEKLSKEVYSKIKDTHPFIQSSLSELFEVECPNPILKFIPNGSWFFPSNTINLDYSNEKVETLDDDYFIKSYIIDALIEEEAHRHRHYANPKIFTLINCLKNAPCHEVSEGIALYARMFVLKNLEISPNYEICLNNLINKGRSGKDYVARMLLNKDKEYFRRFVRLPINPAWNEVESFAKMEGVLSES